MMTKKEKTSTILKVLDLKKDLDMNWNIFSMQCGATVDSPFGEAIWKQFDCLVEFAEKAIGDEHGWLNWFIWDNECGEKGLGAHLSSGKKKKNVRTVNDLVFLIENQ